MNVCKPLFLLTLCVITVIAGDVFGQQQNPEGPMLEVTSARGEIKLNEDGTERVVGTVRRGTRLWALKTNGEFYWVVDPTSGQAGWIRQTYVERIEPSRSKIEEINRLGNQIQATSDGKTRISLYQQMIPLAKQALGEDHPNYAAQLNNFAELYMGQEDYTRAEPLFKTAIDICRSKLGAKHPNHIYCVNALAHLYLKKGDHRQAEDLLLKVIEIQKSAFGDSHPKYAISLHNLSFVYQQVGQHDQAAKLLEQERKILEATGNQQSAGYATCLHNLGMAYLGVDDFGRAEPILKKSLEVTKQIFGDQHPNYTTVLQNIALLYKEMGNDKQAHSFETESRKTASTSKEKIKSRSKSVEYQQLDNILKLKKSPETIEENGGYMVVVTADPGHLSKDRRYRRRQMVTKDTKLWVLQSEGGDLRVFDPTSREHRWINVRQVGPIRFLTGAEGTQASSLIQQANAQVAQGDLTSAVRTRIRAIELISGIVGEHPIVAQEITQLGDDLMQIGDFEKAVVQLERGVEMNRKIVGNDHPFTGKALNSLAGLYQQIGAYYKAKEIYLESLAIAIKTMGADSEVAATVMNNLGLAYYQIHEFEAAETLYGRSLKILRRKYSAKDPALADVVNNLALVYQSTDRLDKAIPLLKQSLDIVESQYSDVHPRLALPLLNLGDALRKNKDLQQAETQLKRSLEVSLATLGDRHSTTQLARQSLAKLYEVTDRSDKAMQVMDASRRSVRKEIAKFLPAFSEEIQETFILRKDGPQFAKALSLGLANKSDPQIAATSGAWLINGKSIIVDAMADSTLLQQTGDQNLRAQLKNAQAELSKVALQNLGGSGNQDSIKREFELEQACQKIKLEIVNQQLAAKPDSSWISVSDVRRQLAKNQMFVNIARVQIYDFESSEFASNSNYLLWLISGDSEKPIVILDLNQSQRIDSAVTEMKRQMKLATQLISNKNTDTQTLEQIEGDYFKVMRRLGRLVFDPIEKHLSGVDELIISPDGSLWNVPWSAMVDSRDQYLVENYQIRFVGSGREIARDVKSSHSTTAPVIFANPDFDLGVSQMDRPRVSGENNVRFSPGAHFTELPGTEIEAVSVKPSLESYVDETVKLLVEDQAQESEFKKLRSPRVLIFSTHGYFTSSTVPLAPGSSKEELENFHFVPPINPLLRCGLGLAGSNNRDQAIMQGKDDGILTGLEIVATDLRGTELVVLSACETAVGDVRDGQGVAGLRQAFLLAGAQSVVATLWQVPDRDSALIMNDFFKNLAAGQSRPDALRHAQLKRIQSRRERFGTAHPFYWAAWTVTGQ